LLNLNGGVSKFPKNIIFLKEKKIKIAKI